jgi:hypothetical protein
MIKRLLVALVSNPLSKWDKLIIVAEQCLLLPKPILVKLTLEQLLQVLGFNVWGMGSVP